MTDIAYERRKLAAQGLQMRTREQWGATFSYTDDRFVNAVADDLFLHIAVVDDPGDLQGTEDQVARTIERIGVSRFPNTGISYNALAFNSGRLYEAQPLTRRGAHTVNDKRIRTCPTHGGSLYTPGGSTNLNYSVRALCLPQQVTDAVTDAQIDSAARWGAALIRAGFVKPTARWHGHRCCAWKDCPGQRAFDRIPELLALTRHYRDNGLGPTPPLSEEDDMPSMDELNKKLDPDVVDPADWARKALGWRAGKDNEAVRVSAALAALLERAVAIEAVVRDAKVQAYWAREWSKQTRTRVKTLLDRDQVDVHELAGLIVQGLHEQGDQIDQATVEAGVRAVFAEIGQA